MYVYVIVRLPLQSGWKTPYKQLTNSVDPHTVATRPQVHRSLFNGVQSPLSLFLKHSTSVCVVPQYTSAIGDVTRGHSEQPVCGFPILWEENSTWKK